MEGIAAASISAEAAPFRHTKPASSAFERDTRRSALQDVDRPPHDRIGFDWMAYAGTRISGQSRLICVSPRRNNPSIPTLFLSLATFSTFIIHLYLYLFCRPADADEAGCACAEISPLPLVLSVEMSQGGKQGQGEQRTCG